MIQLFASSSDRPSRLKRLLTGGIVATVLGGLLATGMTSVASAAPVTGLTVNVVADGVVVPNILVEVYKANDDYKYSLAEATTDTSGSAVFELDNDLVVGDEYVVAVSKTYSTPGAFATFSNGFVDGTSATLVDDAQSAAPVVLAGATVRTVALNAGAVITGSVFAPNGDDFEDQGTSITAYRKSVNMDSGAVQWDYEGQAGTIEVTEDEEGQPVGNLTNDFTLNGLRAGDYVLSFTQNGQPTWVSTIFNGGASGINTATPVAITRDAATTINGDFLFGESISGTVTIPEVTDIPENQFGVSATLLNSDGTLDDITGGGSASVNPDGSYSITGLAFGSYAVHFDVYDDADFYGEWYNNAATSGSATPVASGSIGIDAEIGDGFTLTVLADSGNGAIEGAKVSLRGAETNELYNLVTGYNGKAVFTNVAPDAYTVTVEHPDFDPDNPDERYSTRYVTSTDIGSADWRDALLVAGVNEELSVGVKFAGSAIATVTVLDPTGKPLTTRGSSVVAEVISGGDLVRSAKRVNGFPVAGKPGVFTLDLDTETDYAISVDPDLATSYPQFLGGEPAGSDDYSNVTPFYSGTEDFALTFGLVSGGKISGVVKSTAGKAILEVGVDIFQFNGSDWVRVVGTRTSKTGAYSVAVEPGSYKVGFNAQESSSGLLSTYFTGYTEIEALPTVYVGKSATAVINGSLAPAGSITGTATKLSGSKAVAAASIIVRPIRINDMFSRTVFAAQAGFTNAKGQFTITGLPAGTYELSFEDNSAVLGDVYSPAAAGTTYVVVAGKAKAAGSILLPTAAATRTAIVTGSLSASVPGAQGTVEFQSEDGLYYSVAEITGSGQFTTKLVPGVYNYTATFKGSAPLKYRGVVDTGLHFEQGPNTLEIPAIIKTPLAFETNPTIWTDFDLPVAVDGAYLQVDAQWDAVRAKATYQWLRDGIPIYGETNAYHQPTNADAGSMVAVRVTLDNKFGLYSGSYETIRATSEGVYVPFEGQVSNGGVELIAGPLGRVPGSVLTANTFAWADGTSLSYTWLREGQEIEGVTSPTYTVQPGDIGLPITVVVQGHRPGYEASGNIAANSVTIQPNAGATNVKKPTVTSTTKGAPAGTVKYTVTPGTWSVAGTTPAYTWYLDAEPQDNGTNSFLLPTTETRALYVEVSATKTGYIQSQPVAVLARKGTALPTGGATVYDNRTDDEVYADDTVYVGTKFYLEYNYGVIAGAVNPATFQWQRKTGTTWAAIAKATASTYTVTTADAGKALQVVVKASSTYYGTATTVVAAGTAALDPELKFDRADSVSVSGTGVVSSTLTAVIDSEGFEIAGAAVAYQWGTQAGDVFTPIAKATKSTFVIPANLLGKEIRVRVTSTKAGYEPSVERSLGVLATTGTITVVSNVDITGSANVGSKLTAKPAVTDVTGTKRTYLWERFDGEEGEWDAVAQTATYTPTAALRGSELRVTETITKAAHDTVSSEKTVVIGYGVATVKTAPKVTTAATTYKVSAGVSTPAATPTYQWIVAGEEVEEYSATYMRNPSDAGKLIAVEVSYSVPGFETKVVYLVAQKAAAPVLGGPLVLDGAQVGTASVADNQLAAPVEVVGSTINPTYTFQWLLSGKAIKGATKESYVPLAAQVGKPLSVKITSTSIEHVTATWTSAATTVAKGAPAAEGVVYSGSYWGFVGATFVATVETPQPGYTVSYQWFRKAFSSSSSPVAIAKATTLSYKTVLADQDAAVSLVVTYKRSGYEDKVYTAATVDIYGENGLYALSAPVVSGSGAVGTPLTVSTGIWTFTPTLTYQWKRNGIEIPGVTGTSYTPQGDHLGDVISVYVVAKRAGFDSNYANSNEVKVVRGAAPTATGVNAPKVTGRAATCSTLTATPGVWSLDGVQLSYQWYLHGDGDYAVPGATKSTYATEPSSLGARVFVRVTATRDGYAVGTADSVLTAALTEGC